MTGQPLLKIEIILKKFGIIKQLVEHDLAKVGVASSSLVFRSRFSLASVGLFSYVSVCYATLTWLWRICGLVRNFSGRRWIFGKMRLI